MTNKFENKITVPVLLVGFNRPDTTQQVFDHIRKAKPEKLYVAVDGPRDYKEGESEIVQKVKEIVQKVDWPCKTQFRFSEKNQGAEVTVSSAISWVFESEDCAIILEDDIVAPVSFFHFMQEMLIKYQDDKRIGLVSGNNFTPVDLGNDDDYFFARYGHSWGWGTWKRTWKNFDLNLEVKDEHLRIDFLKSVTNSDAEAKFYRKRFSEMKERGPGNSTWDFVGNYIFRINGYLSIIPRVNLTSNIGVYGLHARGVSDYHFRKFDESFKVKNHPSKVDCNIEYDKHHFIEHFVKTRRPMHERVINKLSRILFSKNYFK